MGVYIFALLWLQAAAFKKGSERVVEQPITAAAALIAGSAMAGVTFRILKPRARHLPSAIGVGIVCAVPLFLGIALALRSLTISTLGFGVATGVAAGTIWGTMAWKGWYR